MSDYVLDAAAALGIVDEEAGCPRVRRALAVVAAPDAPMMKDA